MPNGSGQPTVFIGSSSEGKRIAEAIQLNFDNDLAATVWSQGLFRPSRTPLQTLDQLARDFDFAVLVVTPDDVVESRGQRESSPRDNVVFEAGFFAGRFGMDRTFLVCPRDLGVKLPSDLDGLTTERFDLTRSANLQAALGPACTRLKNEILGLQHPIVVGTTPAPRIHVPRPRRRRSLGRVRVQGPLEHLLIENISVTGALLATPGELPVGKILDLDLSLDNGATLHVTARVVRVQAPGWGRVGGVGVAFTKMDETARTTLESFVEHEQTAA